MFPFKESLLARIARSCNFEAALKYLINHKKLQSSPQNDLKSVFVSVHCDVNESGTTTSGLVSSNLNYCIFSKRHTMLRCK